jgi:RNA polymerase sigma-70 factor (ECF subfamily)
MSGTNLTDSQNWVVLVSQHYDKVFGTALALTRHVSLAEDAAQETFLKAFAHRHQFNGQASPATWLHAIAENVCRDLLRRENRNEHADLAQVKAATSGGPSPEDAAHRSQVHAAVRAAMVELPEAMRRTFEQTVILGYSYSEAAAIESVPLGTVASRVARTRMAILHKCKGIEP